MASWKKLENFDHSGRMIFTELEDSILAYQPLSQDSKYYSFPCSEAVSDWANCLFCDSAASLIVNQQPPILYLNLHSTCGSASHLDELRLIDFIRFLRLSEYHPQALPFLESRAYKLWSSPIVCFSFESRESILLRKPEALALYAPSIRFQQLPALVQSPLFERTISIKPAEPSEVSNYINVIQPVNLSSHHGIGDVIGPFFSLKELGFNFHGQFGVENPIKTGTVQEIFWQTIRGDTSTEEQKDKRSEIYRLCGEVLSTLSTHQKPSVMIIDNQSHHWRTMWEVMLGGINAFTRKDSNELFHLLKKVENGVEDNQFFDELRNHSLLIVDLRLKPLEDEYKELKEISGYKLLTYIREHDEGIPILLFTSSQRSTFLQEIEGDLADAVCNKPVKFDNCYELLKNLLEGMSVLLKPEFEFLRTIYDELKRQELRLQANGNTFGEESFYWAFSAWGDARRELKSWLRNPTSEQSRLSALSVARKAAFAQEVLSADNYENKYFRVIHRLRNNSSHVRTEEAQGVHTFYLMIELLALLLKDINATNGELRQHAATDLPKAILLDDFSDKLHRHVGVRGVQSKYLKLSGSIQASTLLYWIQNNIPELSYEAKKYLEALQERANQTLQDDLQKAALRKEDIEQVVTTQTFYYPNRSDWLNTIW